MMICLMVLSRMVLRSKKIEQAQGRVYVIKIRYCHGDHQAQGNRGKTAGVGRTSENQERLD